ncbi:MAG: glycosyltransferase family 39 protein [Chitinophagaceae bacterium]|nr:glycosyltransferase family 39 protein [Chitinophagaceae bacterium]
MNTKLFFFLVFAYQMFFIFQGVDLSDEGFYATFYQLIYTDPATQEYNFMFWLSGIVGGAFVNLFPDLGLWGIRLAGVLVTTSTIILTYQLLKGYINRGYLKLGLLLVLFFVNNNLKQIHYNDLSALFNMLTIYFLFFGLKQNSWMKIFLAGLFVSLCTFTRLPNVLSLGLGLAIFYYGYHHMNSAKTQFQQALAFAAGFVLTTALILFFMKAIGHLDIFVGSIELLSKMGKGGEESFYGPMVLVKNFIATYYSAIKFTLIMLVPVVLAAVVGGFMKKQGVYNKWIGIVAGAVVILLAAYYILSGRLDNEMLLYFFSATCIITTILLFFTEVNKDLKLLALAGCFILLTYPFTSSASLYTVGRYSLWLSFPIAIDYLFNFNSYTSRLNFFGKRVAIGPFLTSATAQMKGIMTVVSIILIIGCLYHSYYYPFFDKHERTRMAYAVDNKYMRAVYTTKERATILNELLAESDKYVRAGEYVLAYHSIPMYHYMTQTKPFLRNSMPWFYEAALFSEELNQSLKDKKILPAVVQQLKKTVGNAGNWPDAPAFYDSAWHKKNEPRDSVLNSFLQRNSYKEVWKNDVFRILVPSTDTVNNSLLGQ